MREKRREQSTALAACDTARTRDPVKDVAILVENAKRARSIAVRGPF